MNYFIKLFFYNNPIKLLYGFCAPTDKEMFNWREKHLNEKHLKIYISVISQEEKEEFLQMLSLNTQFKIDNIELNLELIKGTSSITANDISFPVGESYTLTEYWQQEKNKLIDVIKKDTVTTDRVEQEKNVNHIFELINKESGVNLLINCDRLGNFELYEPLRFYNSFEVSFSDIVVKVKKNHNINEKLIVSCENRIANRMNDSKLQFFESNKELDEFKFNETLAEITVKIWAINGELVFLRKTQRILSVNMNINLSKNKTVVDRWSKKLRESSSDLIDEIKKIETFKESTPDRTTRIAHNEPIWYNFYNEGKQIGETFKQHKSKGCFVPKIMSKKGEIDSFFKIKEYIEEAGVKKVILADPFFSVVSSEKFLGRIAKTDVELLIITSLTKIDPDTGKETDILGHYKRHLDTNANLIHKNTTIFNVMRGGNQAFHDRYLIRYFDDDTMDGFILSNSLNAAGQNYSFVVAPLEKSVCYSVEDYLNKLVDADYQKQQNHYVRLSIEKIFPVSKHDDKTKAVREEYFMFPAFLSGYKEREMALQFCVDNGFIEYDENRSHYKTNEGNWSSIIKSIYEKWDELSEDALYALGDAIYHNHSAFDNEAFEIIANHSDFSTKIITKIKRIAPDMEKKQKHQQKGTESDDYTLWAILNNKATLGSMFRMSFINYRVLYNGRYVVWKYLYSFLLYKDRHAFMDLLEENKSPLMLSLLFETVGIENFDKTLYNLLINSRWEFLHELGAKWLYDSEDKTLIDNTISELDDEKALEQAVYLASEVTFRIRISKTDLTKWASIFYFLTGRIIRICNQRCINENMVLKHLDKLNDIVEVSDANLKVQIARGINNKRYKSFLYDKIIKRYKSIINRPHHPPYKKGTDDFYLQLVLEGIAFEESDHNKCLVRILHWDLLNYFIEPFVVKYNYHLWNESNSKISWDIALLDLYKDEYELDKKLTYFYQTVKSKNFKKV